MGLVVGLGGWTSNMTVSSSNVRSAMIGMAMNLRQRWNNTWRQLGLATPAAVVEQLLAKYSEAGRYYHTLQHLGECFAYLERSKSLAAHPEEVEMALWFHDAIYDTRAKDSEERSAAWAEQALRDCGAAADLSTRVRDLILVTKHAGLPAGADACLLVDIDLSILGAPEERFDEYENQVRQEYGWVPEADFRAGREKVLQQFLERDAIYSTELFRAWLEAKARTNLGRSLQRLRPSRS